MELNVTTLETAAGTYRIAEHYDDDGSIENPLTEYDHPGMSFAIFQDGRYETLNTLGGTTGYARGSAGNAIATWLDHGYDDEDIERRFALWRAITGDQTVLVTYQADDVLGFARSTWYRCLVLVDYDAEFSSWDRAAAATATIRGFESWAAGEVYGYIVTAPDGQEVDSCWGFIGDEGRQDMLKNANDAIEYDAKQRLDKANLVGAGFVGIV